MSLRLWGIDLGGTKIEGAVIDPARSYRVLCRLRVPTQSELGYDHVVGQVRALVEQVEAATGIPRPKKIGIGTPGVVEPATGLVKNSNSVCLNGRPLARDLAKALRAEVHLANDANCFALAETTLGVAKGRVVVVGLILGTGVGSGIVVGDRVLEGRHGIAGEWGHNPMRDEDTPCYCGRRGCVETVISGPALVMHYHKHTGRAVSLPDIEASAARGDAGARATMARLRGKFGEAVAVLINILDPDAIVIGGGVGNIASLFDGETREAVRRHLFNPDVQTEFLRPALGDSAGVFGAALLTAQGTPMAIHASV